MVKSRNQMIIDLTAPLTKNSAYKNLSQREAWRPFLLFHNCTRLFSREFLENIFPKRKNEN